MANAFLSSIFPNSLQEHGEAGEEAGSKSSSTVHLANLHDGSGTAL
jgi:cation transporter-like permease